MSWPSEIPWPLEMTWPLDMPWPYAAAIVLFLVLGGLLPVRASRRRSSFHLRNSTAMALFFIMGLDSLRFVLPSVLVCLVFLAVAARRRRRRSLFRRLVLPPGSTFARTSLRLLLDTAFLVTGLFAGWWVYRRLGGGQLPFPLAVIRDVLVFMATSTALSLAIAVQNEFYYRLFSDPVLEASSVPKELAFLPSDAPLYRLMLVMGTPLQLVAQFFYLSYGLPGLLGALLWFALAIALHGALLKERLRLHRVFRELEASQRALILGEVSGRIVHQTRHQLGLIGISTHLIREAMKDAAPDRARILTQLEQLDGVAREMRRMLSEDLEARRGEDAPEPSEERRPEGKPVSLRDLVREEVERLRGRAEERGLELIVEAESSGLVAGSPSSAEKLSQGIFNVVENALAAARRSVSVRLVEDGALVSLIVTDDGPGIPPEILPRAAEPFVTTKDEGSGMGLFLATAAAARFGGELVLENQPRGGLRATFRLPVGSGLVLS
jgi:signal transduction histidine kinase